MEEASEQPDPRYFVAARCCGRSGRMQNGATNFENADRTWICIAAGFLSANKPRGPRVSSASIASKINVLIVGRDKKRQLCFLRARHEG